jgi:hypothetical protein
MQTVADTLWFEAEAGSDVNLSFAATVPAINFRVQIRQVLCDQRAMQLKVRVFALLFALA